MVSSCRLCHSRSCWGCRGQAALGLPGLWGRGASREASCATTGTRDERSGFLWAEGRERCGAPAERAGLPDDEGLLLRRSGSPPSGERRSPPAATFRFSSSSETRRPPSASSRSAALRRPRRRLRNVVKRSITIDGSCFSPPSGGPAGLPLLRLRRMPAGAARTGTRYGVPSQHFEWECRPGGGAGAVSVPTAAATPNRRQPPPQRPECLPSRVSPTCALGHRGAQRTRADRRLIHSQALSAGRRHRGRAVRNRLGRRRRRLGRRAERPPTRYTRCFALLETLSGSSAEERRVCPATQLGKPRGRGGGGSTAREAFATMMAGSPSLVGHGTWSSARGKGVHSGPSCSSPRSLQDSCVASLEPRLPAGANTRSQTHQPSTRAFL